MTVRMRLIVAVTSATALLEVNKTPSLLRAIHGLQDFWPTLPLTITVDAVHSSSTSELLAENRISHELLICNPCDPQALARALEPESKICNAFLIHDASRPLISSTHFTRLVEAFTDSIDAVRSSIAFTETLKIIGADSLVKETLDRTKVRRKSTPELIRVSAIDMKGKGSGWFLPLRRDACTLDIEGIPESLRINSVGDRDLLESFLHWRQING